MTVAVSILAECHIPNLLLSDSESRIPVSPPGRVILEHCVATHPSEQSVGTQDRQATAEPEATCLYPPPPPTSLSDVLLKEAPVEIGADCVVDEALLVPVKTPTSAPGLPTSAPGSREAVLFLATFLVLEHHIVIPPAQRQRSDRRN
jgi:hypothetical protein